jgi:hypothetical protein
VVVEPLLLPVPPFECGHLPGAALLAMSPNVDWADAAGNKLEPDGPDGPDEPREAANATPAHRAAVINATATTPNQARLYDGADAGSGVCSSMRTSSLRAEWMTLV